MPKSGRQGLINGRFKSHDFGLAISLLNLCWIEGLQFCDASLNSLYATTFLADREVGTLGLGSRTRTTCHELPYFRPSLPGAVLRTVERRRVSRNMG